MFMIFIFSVIMLLVINVFYRFLINQNEVVAIKERVKELEKEAKKYKDDKEKTKEYFSKTMEEQKKISKMSLKPMLVSFVVVIIFLPFLSAMYVDHQIVLQPIANSSVMVGNITLANIYEVQKDNATITVMNADKKEIVECDGACLKPIDGKEWRIYSEKINDKDTVKFADIVAVSPMAIPFLGYELGWIWWYIILSIPLSIIIKKLLGVKI